MEKMSSASYMAKGPLTWRISSRAEIVLRLHEVFKPGRNAQNWAGKLAGKRCTFTTEAVRMAKFQSGLKFEGDYMRFFNTFQPRLRFMPGLKLSSCNGKRLFKICLGSRSEI